MDIYQHLINKILTSKDTEILTKININYLELHQVEYNTLNDHFRKYNTIMDVNSFRLTYPSWEYYPVNDASESVILEVEEQHTYVCLSKLFGSEKFMTLKKTNAIELKSYVAAELARIPSFSTAFGTDLIQGVDARYEAYLNRINSDDWYLSTGFKELDTITNGLSMGEDFMVIVSTTGSGKSWLALKMCTSVFSEGKNVGFISPEMSSEKIGMRFDTLFGHFSHRKLLRGIHQDGYDDYVEALKNLENKFIVAQRSDFNSKITVSKLRSFVYENKLDLICIDGLSYLEDERYQRGDSRQQSLANISEDLMELSRDLKVPVIGVVQSNRQLEKGAMPDIDNIRDSSGISFNATKILSIRQRGNCLEMSLIKNREGEKKSDLSYLWNYDIGEFQCMPKETDGLDEKERVKLITELDNNFKDEASPY